MKPNIKALLFLFILISSSLLFTQKASAQQSNVSFQVFYDQLSPYGEWVSYPDYGYVWIPDAGTDFVPYSTQGHWILTDFGWTWMSDYSWGWAPFHYGRWNLDNNYGWFWVPDNQWGPAWVSWRRADGYYGWAPMQSGISLSVSFGRSYDNRNDHWTFVRDRDIDRSDINHYYINRTDQDRIIRNSSVINNTYSDNRRHTTFVTGPARNDFQKATGRQVNPVTIQENNKPGQTLSNGHLTIYRPEIVKTNDKEKKPAPARLTNLQDVKHPSERKVTNQQGNLNSTNNSKEVRQTNTVNMPKNSNNTKILQTQNSNPSVDTKTVKQPVNVKQQNINPSQNNQRDQQSKSVKTLNTTPSQNIQKAQQPKNVKTLNTTPAQDFKREQQPNNAKTQNLNPPQNIKGEQQSNSIKTQNTNQVQNTGRGKQSNAAKSAKNNRKAEQKNSNNEKDIKQNK
jgi:hypothetical protein